MQTAQPTERLHRNHGLFSDHYLNTTLTDRPDWQALENEAAGKMTEVARLLEAFTPSANEVAEHVVRQPNGRFAFWGVRKGEACICG